MNTEPKAMEPPEAIAVSQEIIQYLEKLVGKAEKTGCRIDEQLQGICLPAISSLEKVSDDAEREYPVYFSCLREKMRNIEYSLNRVNEVLDRCGI